MEHDAYNELTAAYALDALEEDETRAYEEHLAGCEICQTNLAELSGTMVQLAFAAPPVDPPPELRGRILEAARAERQNAVQAERESPARAERENAVRAEREETARAGALERGRAQLAPHAGARARPSPPRSRSRRAS